VRLWKVELQKLANHLRLPISVCHFPPGTSKWNRIDHRLFSFITKNWRGRPLITHAVIVNLIGATTTPTGLRVRARLDTRRYPSGLPVSREAVEAVQLRPDAFHGAWNYTILPTPSKQR
jgi:Rhodopirellula transposase DDE domain